MNHEHTNMNEQNILLNSLDTLKSLTNLEYQVLDRNMLKNGFEIDAKISIGSKKAVKVFYVEIKNELRGLQLPKLLDKFEKIKHNANILLISTYIPAPTKIVLRNHRINYLEASGNAYINADELYIYINDQPVTQARTQTEGKLWTPGGLRFLFAILLEPNLINESYRKISERSGVALGTIKGFIDELEKEGYLKNRTKEGKPFRFFEQEDRLRDKWAELYKTTLRPKLSEGKYRFIDKDKKTDWKNIKTEEFIWGGENAGALLTNYLSPEKFTIYTKSEPLKLMRLLKLVPDNEGELEIFRKFWNDATNHSHDDIIPPILAYCELITSFDSRCRETANRIKTKYLEQ